MNNFKHPAPPPPPEPPPVEPPVNEPPPVEPPAVESPPAKEAAPAKEKTFTQAQLDAEKKKWEKESAKKISDAEAKSKLTEDEKLKAERDEAVKNLRERDSRDAVTDLAEKAGVKNPKLFYNAYKDELEFDDKTGKVTNLDDVLASAKADAPELFGTPIPTPGGGADAGEGKQTPGGLTLEKIKAMSEKEIIANMTAIDEFYASQK